MRAVAVSAVAALVLAGCSGSTDGAVADDPAPATTSSSAAASAPAAPPEQEAPGTSPDAPSSEPAEVAEVLQFEATTVSGESFDGASVAGRPVVLWFWAPWCAVCRSQAPEVTALVEEYGDRVSFVGVGSLDSGDAIEEFATGVEGPTHLSDTDGELYRRFGIAEQSSFVVLDAAGDEVLRTGYSDDDELAGTVADLAG